MRSPQRRCQHQQASRSGTLVFLFTDHAVADWHEVRHLTVNLPLTAIGFFNWLLRQIQSEAVEHKRTMRGKWKRCLFQYGRMRCTLQQTSKGIHWIFVRVD